MEKRDGPDLRQKRTKRGSRVGKLSGLVNPFYYLGKGRGKRENDPYYFQ